MSAAASAEVGADHAQSSRMRRRGRLIDLIGPAAFPAVWFTTHDFTAATWATLAGSLVAVGLRWRLDERLAPLSAVAGAVALLTAALAAIFGAKAVLQAKPTVLHLAIGVGLLVAWRLDGRPVKTLLGGALALTDRAWATLCLRFGLFALVLAIVNETIRRTEPTSVWALFHFPGQLLAHLLFLATQIPLILASRLRSDPAETPRTSAPR